MIRHVAVFKWKPGFPDSDLQEWMDRLRALPAQIEELSSLTVGSDVLHGDRSWDAGVVADLPSMRALTTYNEHPEHQAILKISAPNIAELIQVDFEIPA
jgi:hypothetical protein